LSWGAPSARPARLLSFEQALKDSLDFDGDSFRQDPGRDQPAARLGLKAGLVNLTGIGSTNERAQAYFDQGLRLAYAFNHGEAQRAFRMAQ
jgi:hypothetical protein